MKIEDGGGKKSAFKYRILYAFNRFCSSAHAIQQGCFTKTILVQKKCLQK
jgi:hypothetical protein